jgi:hypothetical protein
MNTSALYEYEHASKELNQAWVAHKAFMDRLTFYRDGDVSATVLWNEFYRVERRLRNAQDRHSRVVTQFLDTISD